jgi:hypothetical protein
MKNKNRKIEKSKNRKLNYSLKRIGIIGIIGKNMTIQGEK